MPESKQDGRVKMLVTAETKSVTETLFVVCFSASNEKDSHATTLALCDFGSDKASDKKVLTGNRKQSHTFQKLKSVLHTFATFVFISIFY